MADRAGFKVEGLTKVVRGLKALGLEVDDLKSAFSAISSEGARVAAGFAPHKSGRLAGDIRGNRAQSKAVITAGRATVRYAGPINYGWPSRGIRPSAFMQRTDDVMRPRALTMLEDEINRQARLKGL